MHACLLQGYLGVIRAFPTVDAWSVKIFVYPLVNVYCQEHSSLVAANNACTPIYWHELGFNLQCGTLKATQKARMKELEIGQCILGK